MSDGVQVASIDCGPWLADHEVTQDAVLYIRRRDIHGQHHVHYLIQRI
jgi:hypothetical protein